MGLDLLYTGIFVRTLNGSSESVPDYGVDSCVVVVKLRHHTRTTNNLQNQHISEHPSMREYFHLNTNAYNYRDYQNQRAME